MNKKKEAYNWYLTDIIVEICNHALLKVGSDGLALDISQRKAQLHYTTVSGKRECSRRRIS